MMERSKRLLWRRSKLGKSTMSQSQTIHVPTRVVKNYDLKKGSILEWYPPQTDFPDGEIPNLLAVLVISQEYATVAYR